MSTMVLMSAGLTAVAWWTICANVRSAARELDPGELLGWRVAVLGGILVAVLWSTACSATAMAAVIPGDPLRIFMDGSGQLQARFQGYTAGELRPAYLDLADRRSGMVFTIYGSSGTSIICGPSAVGGPPSPVSAPTVTGAGTVASPYQMSTSYICAHAGDELNITQTFIYVNGESGFVARYTMTNPGAQAVRFSAVCRGVFTAAESGQGQGFFDATSPRLVGMFNDAQGSEGGFVEAASTPWTRYMEGALPTGNPYEPGESELFGGLSNTVDPSLVTDPRAAVQLDRNTSFGLAPGATDTYDVNWFFGHYDGLSLSPLSGSQLVGETRSVSASSLNHGQPVSGGTIRYAITGANPSSGSVSTAANGTATIAWIGSQAGQDTLSAYIDSDNNDVFDPAIDTRQAASFSWTAPASPVAPPPPPVPPPPIPPPPAPPPRPSLLAPSNRFAVTAAKARAGGVIRLTLRAAAPGTFRAVATSRRSSKRTFAYGRGRATTPRAGRVTLTIRPTQAAKRRLTTAHLKVAVAVTFTPTRGGARTNHLTVVVKARKRPRARR